MALRASENEDPLSSPLSGVQLIWQGAKKPSSTDYWEQWIELFELVLLAKNLISIFEMNRTPTEENPRVPALFVNLT